MSLLLANILSTLMALASLGALIVVGRKANETIKLGKVLALRVAAASNGLEEAIEELNRLRKALSRDMRQADTLARSVADSAGRNREPAVEQKEKNALPVFVHRAVRKATVEIAGQA
jgi:hypothetical protein